MLARIATPAAEGDEAMSKELAKYEHPSDYVVIPVAMRDRIMARLNAAEALVRRCAIELSYVASVENCGSGLCASSEGAACIEAAEKLLGPMRRWSELRGEER